MKKFKFSIFLSICLLLFACPNNDLNEDEPTFQPITYELLSFVFTPQTSNNEDSLFFEIEFFNSNNFEVTGTPKVTTSIGGGATATFTPNAQCQIIPANSSCVLSYFVEDNNPNVFPVEPPEFVSAEYVLD